MTSHTRTPLMKGCLLPPLLGRRGLGGDFPEATSRIAPPNRADAVAFSLSSIGGEGWGEEALSGRSDRGSWGASTSFDAYWDHEPHQLANHCRRDPPLPEGEGRGEGKRGVRIPTSSAPPLGSWK